MRSTLVALLLASSLAAAAPATAGVDNAATPSLPGITQEADQSLWCATMASHLAEVALNQGDRRAFEALAPMAMQLSRQVSTMFVALHVGEPDIRGYLDLYAAEISAVIAGTSPERYAPEQCQGIVAPELAI